MVWGRPLSEQVEVSRRLVAVFAADVEGYSRLMGADEVATLKGLTERRAILDRAIADHRGRIANTAGDSVLAEFSSAVDAVQCAVAAQAALAQANDSVAPERRIAFRIGIHVGDVMVRAGDLFGDGVNIAARLQALAQAGGVCVSGMTYDQVRKVLPLAFTDLGPQQVKNIEEPVRVYAASMGAVTPAIIATDVKPLPLPDKPSIAVLPFQNMSGDPEQEYFADGMVEDIITALSRFKSLFVIARNSSFNYKGRAVDIKQVGRELGVRYVLEGSVRKAAGRVRITGQLIEAATGAHLWADKIDGSLEDIFLLQDMVTERVVGAMLPEISRLEIERSVRKPTDSLDAYDYYLRAQALMNLPATREGLDQARVLLLQALEHDPEFAIAYSALAVWYVFQGANGWSANRAAEGVSAKQYAERALALAGSDPEVLGNVGHVFGMVLREVPLALKYLSIAAELNPNSSMILSRLAWAKVYAGEHREALGLAARAVRLSPTDPQANIAANVPAFSNFFLGNYTEAIFHAELALKAMFGNRGLHRVTIAANALLGNLEQAHQALDRLLSHDPNAGIRNFLANTPWNLDDQALMLKGLRLAGCPE